LYNRFTYLSQYVEYKDADGVVPYAAVSLLNKRDNEDESGVFPL
jgi:hypothetical protein